MATADLRARLKYLNTSAHALAALAPTTAASLGSEFGRLTRAHNLDVSDTHKRQLCSACGAVLVPGKSCTVSIVPQHPRRTKRKRGKESTLPPKDAPHNVHKAMLYSCARCDRKTRIGLRAAKPIVRVKNNRSAALTSPDAPTVSPISKTPAAATGNAGSKQRAKARKQGGLSALLARNKADAAASTTSSGKGLGLMDFMKIG